MIARPAAGGLARQSAAHADGGIKKCDQQSVRGALRPLAAHLGPGASYALAMLNKDANRDRWTPSVAANAMDQEAVPVLQAGGEPEDSSNVGRSRRHGCPAAGVQSNVPEFQHEVVLPAVRQTRSLIQQADTMDRPACRQQTVGLAKRRNLQTKHRGMLPEESGKSTAAIRGHTDDCTASVTRLDGCGVPPGDLMQTCRVVVKKGRRARRLAAKRQPPGDTMARTQARGRTAGAGRMDARFRERASPALVRTWRRCREAGLPWTDFRR